MVVQHGARLRSTIPVRLQTIALASAALLVAGVITVALPVGPARAADFPGQDQIDAAKAAVADAASGVDVLDAAMVDLEDAVDQARQASLIAAEDYAQAVEAKEAAHAELVSANKRADQADQALEAARNNLARVAMDAYQRGGGMNEITAITSATGFDDVIIQSEILHRASSEADSRIQTVKAAEVVAAALRGYAEEAAATAADAARAASTALTTAQESQQQAERAMSQVAGARTAALTRLAEVRHTSVALEQERQDGLAEERRQQEIAAFEAAQKAAQEAAEQSADTTSDVKPKPRPTDPAPEPTTDTQPTTDPAPEPTTDTQPTTDPAPEPTTDPQPTTDPAPEPTTDTQPTTDPAPEPTPPPEHSWNSSPGAGEEAVSKALTLMGAPYQLGGLGPAYDCSGITYTAWQSAGYNISRSSRSQYHRLAKVNMSQIRKGDLVFYGSGRSTASIYHVAIYIGGGMVAEAATYGKPSNVRSLDAWGVSDMIPTVGRP